MNIRHWMRKEESGLWHCAKELVKYEQRQGHGTCIKFPGEDSIYSGVDMDMQVDLIHSQLWQGTYHNDLPKFCWMHGEPLGSVGNGVSMRALIDLAPLCAGFICMREDEHKIWKSIKPQTYLVPKGIDLEIYKPIPGVVEKLSGEPAVLYYENMRGQRNPLHLCVAMQEVHKKFPKARLHIFNVTDKRMEDTLRKLYSICHWYPFLRTIAGRVDDVNLLLNRADIVFSAIDPLYARSIEAFGAGKAFLCPGYREHDYPFQCENSPESIANGIVNIWENYQKIDYRKWSEKYHDVSETVRQSIRIYERFL